MMGKLLFLGTGGSLGTPLIGCSCGVCLSSDPKNKRLRSSALLKVGEHRFLIDAGPDFRQQALTFGIDRLDALLITHAHHDHISGVDDLRALLFRRHHPLPVLLSEETAEDLRLRYHYFFKEKNERGFPPLELNILPGKEGSVQFENITFQYVSYIQTGTLVNGFRIGNLAYVSDIRQFDSLIFEHLKGVKFLILSALKFIPSLAHFSIDEAVDFANQLKAEHVWLTHISHELEHHDTNAYLPSHVRLAYDGLEIDFD